MSSQHPQMQAIRYARLKREWLGVRSSWISEAHYDLPTRTLHVRFSDTGKTWEYQRVAPATAKAFINAPSQGKFIHRVLSRHPNRQGEANA